MADDGTREQAGAEEQHHDHPPDDHLQRHSFA